MNIGRRAFLASAAATGMALRARAQETTKKYTACIIGDSKQGAYGHYMDLDFSLRADVTVTGLADPDPAGRAKHAQAANAQRTYTDYREMLEKERPDLVSIGPRWTVHHREYLLACAEFGAHGIIEKPLCVDLQEADEMLAAIHAKKLKWAIAFNNRVMPIIPHAKRLLEEGLIGTILELRARGKEDPRAGGEDLIVLGSHLFDLGMYLLGSRPAWCFSDVTFEGRPVTPADVREATENLGPIAGDCIHAMYGFPNNVVMHFDSVKNPDGAQGRYGLDVYGTRGVLSIRFENEPRVAWMNVPYWTPKDNTAWQPLPDAPAFAFKDPERERNLALVNDLIAAIEEDRAPQVNLEDGRAVQEMIQAVFESCVQGGRVAIPLAERSHPLRRWK